MIFMVFRQYIINSRGFLTDLFLTYATMTVKLLSIPMKPVTAIVTEEDTNTHSDISGLV